MPTLEALILLSLTIVVWSVSSRRWQRQFVLPLAVVLTFYLVGTSSFAVSLANWGLTFSLPIDTGELVEDIVVLGRGADFQNQRVETVDQLWHVGRTPKIFVSGMMDAQLIIERLKNRGIPSQSLNGEGCSQTTEENAQFTAAIIAPQGVQKILLVTDPPHMLRSVLLFRSFGFTVIPHSSPLPSYWSSKDQMMIVLREYFGLMKYAFTNRFRQRSPTELEQISKEALKKVSEWNCSVGVKTEFGKT